MSPDDKYSRCPDCKRKSVYFRAASRSEDNYRCRTTDCGFYFFTLSVATIDLDQRYRWKKINNLTGERMNIEELQRGVRVRLAETGEPGRVTKQMPSDLETAPPMFEVMLDKHDEEDDGIRLCKSDELEPE